MKNSYIHSKDLILCLPRPDSPHAPFYSKERPEAVGGDQVLSTMARVPYDAVHAPVAFEVSSCLAAPSCSNSLSVLKCFKVHQNEKSIKQNPKVSGRLLPWEPIHPPQGLSFKWLGGCPRTPGQISCNLAWVDKESLPRIDNPGPWDK